LAAQVSHYRGQVAGANIDTHHAAGSGVDFQHDWAPAPARRPCPPLHYSVRRQQVAHQAGHRRPAQPQAFGQFGSRDAVARPPNLFNDGNFVRIPND
jgi:hypothetical protein